MYVNNCLYPAIVPMELAVNYWTSYSAYHEAAFAALMNNKKAQFHLREVSSFPHQQDPDCPVQEQSEKRSKRDKRQQPQPRCSYACISPVGSEDSTESQSPTSPPDFHRNSFISNRHPTPSTNDLKFGINRILSDELGAKDKENVKTEKSGKRSIREQRHFIPTSCPCSSSSCPYVICRQIPSLSSSLSAVHALRPPHYPVTSGADSLPGPYSVLNTESGGPSQPKRKRSWSRAVFSQLQRKGLEKRFEVQKYVTKPDRRQLAAILGLTDAQVKVWFQNRRMKWRHAEKSANQTPNPKEKEDGDNKPSSDGIKAISDSEDESSEDVIDFHMAEDSLKTEHSDSLDHQRTQDRKKVFTPDSSASIPPEFNSRSPPRVT